MRRALPHRGSTLCRRTPAARTTATVLRCSPELPTELDHRPSLEQDVGSNSPASSCSTSSSASGNATLSLGAGRSRGSRNNVSFGAVSYLVLEDIWAGDSSPDVHAESFFVASRDAAGQEDSGGSVAAAAQAVHSPVSSDSDTGSGGRFQRRAEERRIRLSVVPRGCGKACLSSPQGSPLWKRRLSNDASRADDFCPASMEEHLRREGGSGAAVA